MSQNRRRVSVITGFLGSGKTTLLGKVLSNPVMKNTAVLVNEFGKVGLDHHLLKRLDEQTILIGGGCLCCTVRDDLVKGLRELLDSEHRGEVERLDRVIVETSGLADPAPILFTIVTDPVLQHHFSVESVIVAVDAVNGVLHLDRQPESIKQVSVADKILITKTDIASPEVVEQLIMRLHSINPSAEVIKSVYGDIDVGSLFNSHGQSFLESMVPQSLNLSGMHMPDTRSVSLSFDEPIDWNAFGLWLSMLLHARGEDVLRVKGLINVGEEGPVLLNGVQHIIHPPEHLPSWPTEDRRSHVIFIMRNIDPQEIITSLQAFQHILGARALLLEKMDVLL
jgi:G3E family GTPase